METTLLSVLPELSIGALSVVALSYIMIKNNESRERNTQNFLVALSDMRKEHDLAMKEREGAFRALEKEVREKILNQLTEAARIMERVVSHLDRK